MESSSEAQSPPGLPVVQQEAVEKFGTTNNVYEAGFILSDGTFLRRPKGTTFHNYVEGDGSKPGDYAYRFLESGAIRFSRQIIRGGAIVSNVVSAEFTQRPTEVQVNALVGVSTQVDWVAIDYTDLRTKKPIVLKNKKMSFQAVRPDKNMIKDFFQGIVEFPTGN